MSENENRVVMAALLIIVGLAWYLLKRYVDRRVAKSDQLLDTFDWVMLETMPVQIVGIKTFAEQHHWRLLQAEPYKLGAMIYTFVKANHNAAPLSKLMHGLQSSKAPESPDAKKCKYQMKIKAYGVGPFKDPRTT